MPSTLTAVTLAAAVVVTMSCSSTSDQSPLVATTVTAVKGDAQADSVGATLAALLVVKVTDQDGKPVAGVGLAWSPASGFLVGTNSRTDSNGRDSASWTLGSTPGDQTVTVTVGSLAPAVFHATARAGNPALLLFSGDAQSAPARTVLPAPLLVIVRDAHGNGLSGVGVTWTVSGGGALSATTQTTDAQGRAQVSWTLGPAGAQTATATAGALSRTFTATGT